MSLYTSLFSFTRKEILDLFKRAQKKASLLGLKLLVAPLVSPENKGGKLLIVVPKHVGNAPKRNRIRRQLKSIYFEAKLYERPIIAIVLVYPEAKKLSFDHIKNFLITHVAE